MTGGFNKLNNLPPAVLWSVLVLVIIRAGVGGFFLLNTYIYNEKQGDDIDVVARHQLTQNTNADTNTSVVDTADWQTYQNESLGLMLEYPSDWENEYYKDYSGSVKEGLIFGVRAVLHPEDENTQGFAQYSIKQSPSNGLELGEWIEQNETWLNDTSGAFEILEEKMVVLAGLSAKYHKLSNHVAGGLSETYYLKVGDSILTIDMQSRIKSGPDYEAEQAGVGRIFSTINDSISFNTLAWQVYSNDEWGFQLMYPSIYTLQDNQRSPYLFMAYFEYPNDGLSRGCSLSILDSSISDFVDSVSSYGVTDEGDVIINGLAWRQLSYDPKDDPSATDQSKGVSYLIEKSDNVYKFGCDRDVVTTGVSAELLDANINAMMQSVAFIVDTTDLRTYTNDEIGFTFDYPTSWGPVTEKAEDWTEIGEGRRKQINFEGSGSTSFKAVFQLEYTSTDFAPGREIWIGENLSYFDSVNGLGNLCSMDAKDIRFIQDVVNCTSTPFEVGSGVQFVGRIDTLGGESVLQFVQVFAFHTGNPDYPVAALELFLPNVKRDEWHSVDNYPGGGYWSGIPTTDESQIEMIYSTIANKSADPVTNSHLNAFKAIVDSLQQS